MPTSVLYRCHCQPLPDGTGSGGPGGLSTRPLSPTHPSSHSHPHSTPSAAISHPLAPSPTLPNYSTSAKHAYHPLPHLYFCEECDAIRCSSCVTLDIAAWFCPNCLFEVPGASVRSEKARCARNCFSCPICTQVLQVSQTDPGGSSSTSSTLDPLSAAASIGEPPWFLSCTVCRWDSKQVGITFEKPTGLSLQLQKREDSQPALIELDRLKDHFEPFLRSQLAVEDGLATSSSRASGAGVGGGGSAATRAASAALRQSKLLRDVPMLAHHHAAYLSTGGSSKGSSRSAKAGANVRSQYATHLLGKREELKEYKALSSWESGRGEDDARGVLGRREESRRKWLEGMKDADTRVAGLEQRWRDGGEQPARVSELLPSRLPLKAKCTKRCPACRHIIIKPDTKAAQTRYKIKLVAHNYLPDIWVGLVGTKVGAAELEGEGMMGGGGAGGSTMGRAESRLLNRRQSTLGLAGVGGGSGIRSSRSNRPNSVYLGGGSGSSITSNSPSSSSALIGDGGGAMATAALDEEKLLAGRTYVFEATFTNPLDDAMSVRIGIGLPKEASRQREREKEEKVEEQQQQQQQKEEETSQVSTEPDQDGSSLGAGASATTPTSSPSKPPESRSPPASSSTTSRPRPSRSVTRSTREQLWNVHASTTSFPISAFNEVWELEEEEAELLGDRSSKRSTSSNVGGGKDTTTNDDRGEQGEDDVQDEVLLEEEEEEEEDEEERRRRREEEENLLRSGQLSKEEVELMRLKQKQRRAAARRRSLALGSTSRRGAGVAGSRLGGPSGIVRRKGHTTTIAFELVLGREAIGDIEFALLVTYTYKPGSDDVGAGIKTSSSHQQQQQQQQDKSFTFSTAVRLGRCVGLPLASSALGNTNNPASTTGGSHAPFSASAASMRGQAAPPSPTKRT